jgi:glycosyltransferase involved in cell wall biosynthesis
VSRTVDVIVPCYNYGSYLAGCVQSLLDQPRVAVRVLIIDDDSSDNSQEIGLAMARRDERITFRRHPRNQGHIATYNEGFAWATADYVLLISADDLLTPGALGRAVDILESRPDAAFAYGRQISFADVPALPEGTTATSNGHELIEGTEFIRRLCASADNPVATPTVVVRTRFQHQAGGYTKSLPHTADLEMWLRLATLGAAVRLDAYQAFKRMHKTNMQHAYVMNPAGDLVERQEAFASFFAGSSRQVIGVVELQERVTAALATQAFWRAGTLFDAGRVDDSNAVLELATRLDPRVRTRPGWTAMAIKRWLGLRAWQAMRPAAQLLKRGLTAGRATASGMLGL